MIPKECKRLAEDRPDSYWLNVVTNCVSTAELPESIKDRLRFPCHEAAKFQHYWLDVNAMTRPKEVRERKTGYGSEDQS